MQKIAVILAAGKGTRMNSVLPKCAVKLNDKPMINYVVDACLKAGLDKVIVVVGYKKESIISCLNGYSSNVQYVEQLEQTGTASAVKCATPLLNNDDDCIVVLPGDMPLIGDKRIKYLLDTHLALDSDLSILTTSFDDPTGYGRIVRDDSFNVIKIVEEKNADEETKKIHEVNTGFYCIKNKYLKPSLNEINDNNNKHEFDFTDIVEILSKDHLVQGVYVDTDYHLSGINDVDTLYKIETMIKDNKLIDEEID